VGDGDVGKWIATLDAARKLGATVVCPGHGPRGPAAVLEDQQLFFSRLRDRVGGLVQAKKTPREIYASLSQIQADLTAEPRIVRYVSKDGLTGQVEKVYQELTGNSFPEDVKNSKSARLNHARAHALELA
jgi:glyoxylase-like metal-dependent hydrolase (beta-lactamase superfamily II)